VLVPAREHLAVSVNVNGTSDVIVLELERYVGEEYPMQREANNDG